MGGSITVQIIGKELKLESGSNLNLLEGSIQLTTEQEQIGDEITVHLAFQ